MKVEFYENPGTFDIQNSTFDICFRTVAPSPAAPNPFQAFLFAAPGTWRAGGGKQKAKTALFLPAPSP
ncbi:MAG: hypothetical protein WCH61_05130, partial [bacterium]